MGCALALAQLNGLRTGKALSLFPRPLSEPVPTLKHWFVPDHKGWMLGRPLCSVPGANAVNPCWCPCPVFLMPGSQTFTFLFKQLTLLVLL